MQRDLMKLKIVLLSMAAVLNIVAMEEHKLDHCFFETTIRHKDGSKPTLKIVRDKNNKWKAQEGYPYFSFDQTQNADDTKKNYRIKEAAFMALIVEAHQSTFDKKPLHELLEKLRNSIITPHDNGNVYLTEKDCKYRLLAYVRCCGSDCVINGKRTEINDLLFDDEVVS